MAESVTTESLMGPFYGRLINMERHAALTAETYCIEIRFFLRWLEHEGISLAQVDAYCLIRYLDTRRVQQGIDSRSTAKALSALRSFFRFAMDQRLVAGNPALVLENPRQGKRIPEVLTSEQVNEVLAGVDDSTPLGIRDRAMYVLMYTAGLRVSEVVDLDLRDVFFSEGLVRVTGKGNRERLALFGEIAATALRRYLDEARPKLAGPGREPAALFLTRRGKRLSRKTIWKAYAQVASRIGISSKLHTLRHTFATELLAGGADLRSIQELLGHADLASTQIYTHVDGSRLRASHERYMPNLEQYRDPDTEKD